MYYVFKYLNNYIILEIMIIFLSNYDINAINKAFEIDMLIYQNGLKIQNCYLNIIKMQYFLVEKMYKKTL